MIQIKRFLIERVFTLDIYKVLLVKQTEGDEEFKEIYINKGF